MKGIRIDGDISNTFRDLVPRKSEPDQRKNTVHLTDKGHMLTEATLADVGHLGETAFQGFSPKRNRHFIRWARPSQAKFRRLVHKLRMQRE